MNFLVLFSARISTFSYKSNNSSKKSLLFAFSAEGSDTENLLFSGSVAEIGFNLNLLISGTKSFMKVSKELYL
jgi:hypothetical protein